jgi:3-hydroxybutyryl-CoA dehydrogenase
MFTLPDEIDHRPVVIDGAGTLGRRIAAVFAAGGSEVRLFDLSRDQRQAARTYVEQHVADVQQKLGLHPDQRGDVHVHDDLQQALAGGWMVVEAVPERIEIKSEVFGDLDRLAEPDAILCSNSSSIPTSQLITKVAHPERVLNTHYYMPPDLNAVELMSCGKTDEGVIDALMGKLPEYGLVPFRVRRESDGFIFNRIWAAIKRECLMVVEEGVASPEDVDRMWQMFTAAPDPPFRRMDRVGLDVVLAIEEHYAAVRDGIPEGPRTLLHEYINQGRLGVKSARGFYDYPVEHHAEQVVRTIASAGRPARELDS